MMIYMGSKTYIYIYILHLGETFVTINIPLFGEGEFVTNGPGLGWVWGWDWS